MAIGGHHSAKAKTETWLTPRPILDALGPFDLDPCAAPTPRPWDTARTHYTFPQQDGLALPWFGRVWMNPPYGPALGTWLKRLADHGVGTALIFARTETEAFFKEVWERADALLFLRQRLHFHHPDGRRAKLNGGAPSVLIAYGADDAERLLDSGLDGAPVGLKRPVLIHLAFKEAVPAKGSLWRDVVLDVVQRLGGRANLKALYDAIEQHPKARANPNWKAKVRQTVAQIGLRRVEQATYEVARAA